MTAARGATSRLVLKAMSLFGGLQALTIVCGVVRIKLVALLLGTAGVGLFSIFNAALTMLSTCTQLSLRTSAVREIASATPGDRRWSMARIVSRWGWWLGIFGAVVTLLAAPIYSRTTFHDFTWTPWFMLLAVAVMLMSVTGTDQAVMQGMDRLGPLAKSTGWGVVSGLIVSIPLLWLVPSWAVILIVVGYSITNFFATRAFKLKVPSHVPAPTIHETWTRGGAMIKLGGFMTVAAICSETVNYIFIAYLTSRGGTAEVGIYQSGYTIMNRYVGMIFSAIGMEYYPRLAAATGHPLRQRVFVAHEATLLMLLLVPVTTMLAPLAPLAVRILYSSDFNDAVPFILCSLPGIVLRGYSFCLAFLILARGDGRTYLITEVTSALIGLGLNIACYHLWGIAGLGISFSVWYAVYAVMMEAVYRRYGNRSTRSMHLTLAFSLAAAGASAIASMYHYTSGHTVIMWSTILIPLIAIPTVALRLRKMM